MKDAEKIAHVRLLRSKSVGPVTFRKLLSKFGSASRAITALIDGPSAKNVAGLSVAEQELEAALKLGATCLFLGDTNYPENLAAIDDAPPIIYMLGQTNLLKQQAIAIVGARNASAAGTKITNKIAAALGKQGIIIVSGLARGIDTAAHNASIETGTIACLAGGIDTIYPLENTTLYHAIAEKGLLVSEMPPGTKPQARHFPRRNRIISGLSSGVTIVEAAARSGSLITARFAADQGRDIYAVPGSPLDPRSAGANQLIKDGAVLVRSAEDILDELPTFTVLTANYSKTKENKEFATNVDETPTASRTELTSLLSPNPIHIDELVRLSGRTANDVLTELQLMELDGKITRHSGSLFSRNQ